MKDHFMHQELAIQLLLVLFPQAKIYLFGSRGRGTHKESSDIDLAVDMGKKVDALEIVRAKNVLEALNIPQTIDIVDMKRIPIELRDIIHKEGILLWPV